ncbi:unnamed protein product [Acanthocheilonema viteae]|uniref:Uncharacterized protein n=1 Tax=Acanthocheilonema viteae TaxID=6277 RepID=A0A498SPR1_ACAVI|nr:unnamed protein product [Acanthocheilonema viteae]
MYIAQFLVNHQLYTNYTRKTRTNDAQPTHGPPSSEGLRAANTKPIKISLQLATFQLFILFAAVKYGELSVRDNSNIRDVVGENELIDSNQTMATIISQGTAGVP